VRCSTPLRCGRGGAVAVEHAVAMQAWRVVRVWIRAQRQFKRKVRATIFYFYFYADDSVVCQSVSVGVEGQMRPNEMDVLPTTFPFLISWGVESGHDKKNGRTVRASTIQSVAGSSRPLTLRSTRRAEAELPTDTDGVEDVLSSYERNKILYSVH